MKYFFNNTVDAPGTGLYLCQLPTGYGKTFNINQHIIEGLDHMKKGERKLYITQLKKNLNGEDLKKAFRDDEKYHKNVLVVKSVLDHYLDCFGEANKNHLKIPPEFQSVAYENTMKALRQYKTVSKNQSESSIFNPQEIEGKFAEYEREFRREIKNKLKAMDQNPKEILQEMKRPSHKFYWVGKLYPSIFIDDYKIIIMTVNKFFTHHISLLEPTYEYYSAKFLQNTIIFMDEFDATKSVIEDIIIDKSIKRAAEIISLYDTIYKGFKLEDFNKELRDSIDVVDMRIKGNSHHSSVGRRLMTSQQLIKKAAYIKETYHTNISYKLVEAMKDLSYKVLFFDGEFLTINKEGRQFKCHLNKSTGQVDIDYMTDQDRDKISNRDSLGKGIFPLQECLYEIQQFLTAMRAYINYWAQEYQGRNNLSRPEHLNEMLLEEAVNTIGVKLNLTSDELQVLMGPERRSILNTVEYHLRDPFIHEMGFTYYICKDNNNHADTTKIDCFRVPYTPEKYIVHMAQNTKVIAVSATAEIDTVIGNYDLAYLQNALKSDYHPTPADLSLRIKRELSHRFAPYDDKDIQLWVDFVGKEFHEKSSFTDKEYEKQCIAMLNKTIKNDNEQLRKVIPSLVATATHRIQVHPHSSIGNCNYQMERYYKYMYNLVVFMTCDSIQSMLHLGTMLPRKGSEDYDQILLEDLFDIVAQSIEVDLNAKANLYVLGGHDYEAKKSKILDQLSAGEKLLIISSYNTLGAGQNLQYKLVEGRETITLGLFNEDDSRYKYKDIDAIYLGEVTSILPNIYSKGGITNQEVLKRIIQIERLYNNYELDRHNKRVDIFNTFKSYSGRPISGESVNVRGTVSYINGVQKTILQALGRICRTFQKSPTIYIGLDYNMAEILNVEELEKSIQTPELALLIAAIKEEINYNGSQAQDKKLALIKDKLQMKARILSTKTHRWLTKQLEEPWTYQSSVIWEDLREYLLAHPTLSKEEYESYTGQIPIDMFYLTSGGCNNRYLYTQDGDYRDVYISFQGNKSQFHSNCKLEKNSKSKVYEMSEANSTLPDLLKYPSLHNHFQQNNYAVTFKPNEYMMVPAIFNNFYKGILGEEVGRYIWEKEIQVPLHPIKDLQDFEKFDFKLSEDIYIDFKKWSKGSRIEGDKEHKKIKNKMEQVGARLAFIINVQGDETYIPRVNKKDGIIEIPCLINKDGTPAIGNINLIKEILKGEKDVIHQ